MASDPKRDQRRVAYLEALCRTVPYHVVERVLADPRERSVSNELFVGTVLFADLVGFTSLCERLTSEGPAGLERLSAILNQLFSRLLDDAIFPFGGYVVQFGGDSLTVFFRGDDDARRAVAAALTCERIMHGEVGRLLGGSSRELTLRVGLAHGKISVPVMGDYSRRVVLCAGPTSHRALVLQGLAQPNEILADIQLIRRLGNNLEVVARHDDRAVVRGLRDWPARDLIPALGSRTRSDVEEKIALLEPLVPAPLAGRMKSTPSGWRIEGEMRNVVILFAEIFGLDDADAGAEEHAVATNVARSIMRTYRKYGGILAKVDLAERGHRIMVIFGLHMPAENDAERALLAGLESTARIKGYASAKQLDVTARTGVHAGKVFFGAIGSDNKHDITVVGDTVNLAARCAAAARPFEVLVTTPVRNAVTTEFEHSSRGPVRVKGKTSTVSMYVIHAAATGRAHYVQVRNKPRFVAGRRGETERLDEIGGKALAGDGQIVGLCGPQGVGKSFLLAPVINRWIQAGGTGVMGRCRFATRSTPFAPIVAMLKNYFGISDGDDDGVRRERIRDGLGDMLVADGFREVLSLLQPVSRPDGISESLVDLAEVHAREKVLAGMLSFITERLSREPMLYILEDLHFADTLTLELAQRMNSLGGKGRFLMVGTYRPDAVLGDLRRVMMNEIELANLTLTESTVLIAHEMQAEDVDPDLGVFLWQRTEGRPGYLTEILRFLAERQLLERRADRVVAPEPGLRLLEDVVPRSVAQVALARLDDMGSMERRMLRMASAMGRRFGRPILEQLAADVDPEWVDTALTQLTSDRVIIPSTHEDRGYMFRDGVTRAVTYGTIPASERKEIHTRISQALLELPDGDARRTPPTLAMHLERAEEYTSAAKEYRRAARMALRTGLDREAVDLIECWERAVARGPREDHPTIGRRARMLLLKLVATARQGSPARTVSLGRQLVSQFWDELDPSGRRVADYWLGHALVEFGRPEQARARLQRVYNSDAEDLHRSDAARLIALTYTYAQDVDQSRLWLQHAKELAGDDSYRLLRIELMYANLIADSGNIDHARKLYAEVKNRTAGGELMPLAAKATTNVAYCDMLNGHFELATRGFSDSLVMHRALHDWASEANDLTNLGQAHLWAGHYEEARKVLGHAYQTADEIGEELTLSEVMVHLGAAIALTEDLKSGTEQCRRGRERVIASELREVEIAADLHLLRLAILRGDAADAAAQVDRLNGHGTGISNFPLFARQFADLHKRADDTFADSWLGTLDETPI